MTENATRSRTRILIQESRGSQGLGTRPRGDLAANPDWILQILGHAQIWVLILYPSVGPKYLIEIDGEKGFMLPMS